MPKPRIEPRLPKGMRDFLPAQMIKREYVFNIVREMFHIYGFEPLQTPALELTETLMGKYGEDADKLIYNARHTEGKEELSLRYDLTVPLARVVGQYSNEINLPFKRYQLSPVWRAERPQRGRYREFYQCDADIVGVAGMLADAEIISLVIRVLQRLGFPQFVIKINNRKLLTAIGQYAGLSGEPLANLYRSIDKFDKIGAAGVREELLKRGIEPAVIDKIMELVTSRRPGFAQLDDLAMIMGDFPAADEGIGELRALAQHLADAQVPSQHYEFDFTMVRGLGYYTGPIFEAIISEPNLGSVMGGGRYDELVGLFRGESLPTTGMALGIERIIDVMDVLGLYPPELGGTVVQVLVTVFDETTRGQAQALASELRSAGIRTELYMQDKAIGKQIGYADKKGIPVAALLGPDEAAQGVVKFKHLQDGEERTVPRSEASAAVRALIG